MLIYDASHVTILRIHALAFFISSRYARSTMHLMSGFVFGITAQLVATDLNRRLSQIVRNLTSSLEFDGYDEHGNATPAMVIIVMLHNHTSHVWHRLYANLEMNSYN